MTTQARTLLSTLLILASAGFAVAQALPPVQTALTAQATLQQTLLAHVTGRSVLDITAVGNITLSNGTQEAVTISAKGANAVRMDFPSARRSVFYSGQQGWTLNAAGKTLPIEPHAAMRRPTVFPFLDLLTEVANAKLQILDGGTQTLNGHTVRRIILTLPDATPNLRLFNVPLDEALDLYVDTQSFLVIRSVRYRIPEKNINLKVPSVLDFSDYRNISGTQVPFRIVNTVGNAQMGMTVSTLVLQTVTLNTGLADSLFAPQQ